MNDIIHHQVLTPRQKLAADEHKKRLQRIRAKARPDTSIRCPSAPAAALPPMTDHAPKEEEFGSPVNPAMTFASFIRGASKWFNDNPTGRQELSGKQVIAIDEVHTIKGSAAHHDFLDLINWSKRCRQIVVSCDLPLCEYDRDLSPNIISRLSGGLTLEVHRPDREVRHGILKDRFAANNVTLPDDQLSYMADRIAGSARDIDGIVNRLILGAQVRRIQIDMVAIMAVLAEMAKPLGILTIVEIQKTVARHYGVRHADMLSARRHAADVMPRQIAMYLAKQLTPKSLPEIGRRFGGRDHTTVLHAVRKIEALMKTDKELEKTIEFLRLQIAAGDPLPGRSALDQMRAG